MAIDMLLKKAVRGNFVVEKNGSEGLEMISVAIPKPAQMNAAVMPRAILSKYIFCNGVIVFSAFCTLYFGL